MGRSGRSRKRKQQVQRPCDRNELGKFDEDRKGQGSKCKWNKLGGEKGEVAGDR